MRGEEEVKAEETSRSQMGKVLGKFMLPVQAAQSLQNYWHILDGYYWESGPDLGLRVQ